MLLVSVFHLWFQSPSIYNGRTFPSAPALLLSEWQDSALPECITSHVLFFPFCARSHFHQPCELKHETCCPSSIQILPSCAPAVSSPSQPESDLVQYKLGEILARHFEHPPGLVMMCIQHDPPHLCVLGATFTNSSEFLLMVQQIITWLVGRGQQIAESASYTMWNKHQQIITWLAGRGQWIVESASYTMWCKHQCCPIYAVLTSEFIES